MESLGEWLRRELAAREWSQDEFARQIRVSHTTANKLVGGGTHPNYQVLIRIVERLGEVPPELRPRRDAEREAPTSATPSNGGNAPRPERYWP